MERFLNIGLLLFISSLPTPHTFGGEAETNPKGNPVVKADFVLMVKGDLISLTAKDASLKEILEQIGKRLNIEVFALLPEQEKITTEFENLPSKEAIKRLVMNYANLIVSQEGDSRIIRIVALQKSVDGVPPKPVMKEPEIKKDETPIKVESRIKPEVTRKESPPPQPFGFQFDPSQYGQKRQ